MFATIEPVATWPTPCTVLTIDNVSVTPGASALFWYHLKTAAGAELVSASLQLTGDAYAAWGNDDDYLYTYTAAQLGLTIIEIVPDAPPAPPEPVITAPPVLPDGAPVAPVAADPVPAPSNE